MLKMKNSKILIQIRFILLIDLCARFLRKYFRWYTYYMYKHLKKRLIIVDSSNIFKISVSSPKFPNIYYLIF